MKRIPAIAWFAGLILLIANAHSQRIQSTDLVYQGAFRLPDLPGDSNWEYSGYAMTYYPDGDPGSPADGFPGSIFAVGHDQHQQVSEISIPVPVISPAKNPQELNVATTLQEFHDITLGMFGELEIPRAGLAFLPPAGPQPTGKLHFCWGQHFQFELAPSHGWCDLDLAHPNTVGPLFFDGYSNYVSNDYLFEIPKAWADAYVGGKRLASGRFRDGNWSGRGPALFAYDPYCLGTAPAANDTLIAITPLLLYGVQEPGIPEITNYEYMSMNSFKEPDEWSGGAWLTAGDKSAVVLVGTKALGNTWYGFSDGTVWPEEPPYPEVPPWPHDDRGWWSDSIQAQIIFYDPADLAAVAEGALLPYEPQPYATLNIDPFLFDPGFHHERYKRYSVGAACFDRARGLLYIVERRADEEKSLIHVWKIQAEATGVQYGSEDNVGGQIQISNYPNPSNSRIRIFYSIPNSAAVQLTICDIAGKELRTIINEPQSAGPHRVDWDGRNGDGMMAASGVYVAVLRIGERFGAQKITLIR